MRRKWKQEATTGGKEGRKEGRKEARKENRRKKTKGKRKGKIMGKQRKHASTNSTKENARTRRGKKEEKTKYQQQPKKVEKGLATKFTTSAGVFRVLINRGTYNTTTDQSNALFDTCLLYTSPSPRDLSTSRMPSSA